MVVSSLIRNKKTTKIHVCSFSLFHWFCFTLICDPFAFRHLPQWLLWEYQSWNVQYGSHHFKHCLKSHLLFCTVVSLKANITEIAEHIPSIPRVRGERESKTEPEGELKLWEAPQTEEESKKIQESYRQLKSGHKKTGNCPNLDSVENRNVMKTRSSIFSSKRLVT